MTAVSALCTQRGHFGPQQHSRNRSERDQNDADRRLILNATDRKPDLGEDLDLPQAHDLFNPTKGCY